MAPFLLHLSRSGRVAREILLTCAALAGAACVALAILAVAGGYSLILFKTGSMSPTIPAGSVALVQMVPASELHVGDVATVDRPGALPITHRVTGIQDGETPAERVITMRGDANATEDPLPYTVTEVRIVRGSVPHLAPVIAQFGSPWVLGGLTLGAAAVVSWAFWPRRAAATRDGGTDASTADPADDDASSIAAPQPPRLPLRTLAALILAGIAVAPAAALAPAAPAAASSILVVRSDLEDAGRQQLDPLAPLFWHLDIDALAAPADGELDVSFSSTGAPGFGLRAEVRSCDAAWSPDGACPGGERMLHPLAPIPVDGTWQTLWTSATPGAVFLRIALTADPDTIAAGQAGASVTVRATAADQTIDAGMDGQSELPATGGGSAALLAAPAAVLVGLGAALLARTRSRGRNRT